MKAFEHRLSLSNVIDRGAIVCRLEQLPLTLRVSIVCLYQNIDNSFRNLLEVVCSQGKDGRPGS